MLSIFSNELNLNYSNINNVLSEKTSDYIWIYQKTRSMKSK